MKDLAREIDIQTEELPTTATTNARYELLAPLEGGGSGKSKMSNCCYGNELLNGHNRPGCSSLSNMNKMSPPVVGAMNGRRELALSELAMLAKLSDVTGVKRLLDVFWDETLFPHLISPPLKPLPSVLDQAHLMKYTMQLFQTLAELHEREIVHMDLKPECFMIDENEDLVMADFKFALQLTPFRSFPLPEGRGTCGFLAPEVIEGDGYSTAADIWSAGVILCHLILSYDALDSDIRCELKPLLESHHDGANFPAYTILGLLKRQKGGLIRLMRLIISSCLQIDPYQRISAASVLKNIKLEAKI